MFWNNIVACHRWNICYCNINYEDICMITVLTIMMTEIDDATDDYIDCNNDAGDYVDIADYDDMMMNSMMTMLKRRTTTVRRRRRTESLAGKHHLIKWPQPLIPGRYSTLEEPTGNFTTGFQLTGTIKDMISKRKPCSDQCTNIIDGKTSNNTMLLKNNQLSYILEYFLTGHGRYLMQCWQI